MSEKRCCRLAGGDNAATVLDDDDAVEIVVDDSIEDDAHRVPLAFGPGALLAALANFVDERGQQDRGQANVEGGGVDGEGPDLQDRGDCLEAGCEDDT